jgi:hypothetical protein
MGETQEELKPLTNVQLLDAAIWREISSDEPQLPETFIEALFRLLARWMLTRSRAPAMETLTTLCKTHTYVLNPGKNLMNEIFLDLQSAMISPCSGSL